MQKSYAILEVANTLRNVSKTMAPCAPMAAEEYFNMVAKECFDELSNVFKLYLLKDVNEITSENAQLKAEVLELEGNLNLLKQSNEEMGKHCIKLEEALKKKEVETKSSTNETIDSKHTKQLVETLEDEVMWLRDKVEQCLNKYTE